MLDNKLLEIWNKTGSTTMNTECGIHGKVLAACSYDALLKEKMISILLGRYIEAYKNICRLCNNRLTDENIEQAKSVIMVDIELEAHKVLTNNLKMLDNFSEIN